ncbi:MAG: hypothetical protein GY696_30675 [Gammaproteobacteria bacterium]|nr:hypothetical protein [Gammaproteobacteria bacterium]
MNYTGTINYIVLTEAYKTAEGTTTPVCVCLDASRKKNGFSLNDILVAGPSKLSCQIRILLNFRSKLCGLTADLRKFYQSVKWAQPTNIYVVFYGDHILINLLKSISDRPTILGYGLLARSPALPSR